MKNSPEASEGREIFVLARKWLMDRGWEPASNKSMLWRNSTTGALWMSFGDAMMAQMRYDGVDFFNADTH